MKADDFRECIKIGDHVLVVGQTKVVVTDYANTKIIGEFKGMTRVLDKISYCDTYEMHVGSYKVPIMDIVGLDAYGDREYEEIYGDTFEHRT